MDPIEAGLHFVLSTFGAEAGAVLLADDSGLNVVMEVRFGTTWLERAEELWTRARARPTGPLLAPPLLAMAGGRNRRARGLVCVVLPPQGATADVADVEGTVRLLLDHAVAKDRRPVPEGLDVIHKSANPTGTLLKKLAGVNNNVSLLARTWACSRKAIYGLGERYGVDIPSLRRRRR